MSEVSEERRVEASVWGVFKVLAKALAVFAALIIVAGIVMIPLGEVLFTPCPHEVAEQEALKRLIDGEEVPMSEISWLFEPESRDYYLGRYLPVLGYPKGSEEYERLMKELPGHEEIKVRYNSPAKMPGGDEI